jgi:hypothetical protein
MCRHSALAGHDEDRLAPGVTEVDDRNVVEY